MKWMSCIWKVLQSFGMRFEQAESCHKAVHPFPVSVGLDMPLCEKRSRPRMRTTLYHVGFALSI
jgi:hypothetical protein